MFKIMFGVFALLAAAVAIACYLAGGVLSFGVLMLGAGASGVMAWVCYVEDAR